MAHGDDFVGVGRPSELKKVREKFENKYKLRMELFSGEKEDVQEVNISNKIVIWTESRVELEADPRHAE